MAVIGINYSDGNKKNLQYKSVQIHYGNKANKKKLFASGDFVKDWYDCNKFIIFKLAGKEGWFSNSSSVDHFIMDGAPYESAYMHIVDDKAVLKYFDKTDKNYLFTQRDIDEKGIEYFVKEGTQPTWAELRELCGDNIKPKKHVNNRTTRKRKDKKAVK